MSDHEEGENFEESRVDPSELDGVFDMLRQIELRTYIYDSTDQNHSKRDVLNKAWKEIASDIKINGKKVTDVWCKSKWRVIRNYYLKLKKSMKGKSGQAAGKKKPWVYYSTVDRMLSNLDEENENTQSNFEDHEDSGTSLVDNQSQSDLHSPSPSEQGKNESTQVINAKAQKRKRIQENENSFQEKILKVLEQPEELRDQYYHYAMSIAAKLRNMNSQTADYAMYRVSLLMYEIEHPQLQQTTSQPQQTTWVDPHTGSSYQNV